MADIQQFLTRKAGPLPVWGWAALGGGVLSVLYLRGKSQPAQAPADSSGTGPYAPSPIVVSGGPPVPEQVTSPNPSPPGTGDLVVTPGPYAPPGGTFLRISAEPPTLGPWGGAWVPAGTRLTQNGTPVTTQDKVLGPVPMIPVKYLGGTYWVSSYDVSPAGPTSGMGGGSVQLQKGGGRVGRFSSRHVHRQVIPVEGMGGGGPHSLAAAAKVHKVPEVRLMALNPQHWQKRAGRPPRHILIA